MTKRVLIAFDFDHTIVNDNSDIYIQRLAPNNGKIPDDISQLYSDNGWTNYMAAIFKYLHANGTTSSQLLDCVAEIPLVNGMPELLTYLTTGDKINGEDVHVAFDPIIISDANSVGNCRTVFAKD
jgi:pyridoxal phosphate phosphatase PHOSPHO2